MMTRFTIAAVAAAALLGCGSAVAQVGGMNISPGTSPLGMTSPLGIGPGSPVGPAGVPLGATELASPGVSPSMSGTGVIAQCAGIGGSIPQTSFGMGSSSVGTTSGMGSSMTGTSTAGTSGSTSTFDGGGITGTTSGACATTGGSSLAGPAASASSPTGMGSGSSASRIGIPLGSTELGAGGLSPPALLVTPTPSTTLSTMGTSVTVPCPTAGLSTGPTGSTGLSTSTGSC
jgi:hypothetical protein